MALTGGSSYMVPDDGASLVDQQDQFWERSGKIHQKTPVSVGRVERFFNKIKQCRRIASRYDKLAANYLAFINLASVGIWLRTYESTP